MDTIRPRTGLVSPGLERLARDAAHGAPDPTTSAATRYLCVGAHVDPQFADRVIHDVLEERHRAVCPSRGIDLVPIVRHCLAARRRRLARDLAILAVLAASVVVSPVPTATLTLTAWSGWWLHRLARDWVARGPAANLRLLAALAASSSLFVLGAGLALRQAPLASQVIDLRRESLGLVLLPLGVWAVVLVEAAQTRDVLVRQLSRRAFDPGRAPATASPAVQWRLEDLAREQYGHATVYSSFVPFVGSGVPFSTWSLVLDLQRPSRRRLIDGPAPSPRISVVDLQARVVAQLGHLAGVRLDGGERLISLQLERHVFVDGSSFRGSRTRPAEGPTGPQLHSAGTDVERLTDEQAGPARQYLDVRIGSWEEELVVTVHLQFASIGRTLYMEAVSCVLPPINAAYHVVDAMPSRMTPGALLDLVVTTTRTFASAFCRAPPGRAARCWRRSGAGSTRRPRWPPSARTCPSTTARGPPCASSAPRPAATATSSGWTWRSTASWSTSTCSRPSETTSRTRAWTSPPSPGSGCGSSSAACTWNPRPSEPEGPGSPRGAPVSRTSTDREPDP